MGNRGAILAAVVAGIVALGVVRGLAWRRPVVDLVEVVGRDLEADAIRWSGRFLQSRGAIESAPRAEQDALRAHRVAVAIAERLRERVNQLKVLIIGGVVHLEGSVRSVEDRAEAERLALVTSGAEVIADDLIVD